MTSDGCLNGRLLNGYDYEHQAWVVDGRYVRCGHSEAVRCDCYGKKHEGELAHVDDEPGDGPAGDCGPSDMYRPGRRS